MKVVGEDSLKDYAKLHYNATAPIARWLKITKAANWKNLHDVKNHFPSVDYIPQNQYCFNIGGNNSRLISVISFQLGVVTILDIMTHAEYTKKKLRSR